MLLEMTVGGGVMIMIGVIIRACFIHHFPKRTFVFIWLLVAIRLLVPFSLPSDHRVTLPAREAAVSQDVEIPVTQAPVLPMKMDAKTPVPSVDIDWQRILLISGTVISGSYFVMSHYKFRKEMGDSLPVDDSFRKNVQIRETNKVDSPLTYGILRPIILMPKTMNWEDEERVSYVLTHEYVHICWKDYGLKMVLAAALCLHWFNPLVWLMYALANRDIELACDEEVLKILGRNKRGAYVMTLLEMEEKRTQRAVLAFSRNATEERIQVMIKMKKRPSILGGLMALIIVVGALTVLPQGSAQAKDLASRGFKVVNAEQFDTWKEASLEAHSAKGFTEADLEWVKASQYEYWHQVIEEGGMVVDLGDHVLALSDEYEVCQLKSTRSRMKQYLEAFEGHDFFSELRFLARKTSFEHVLKRIELGATVIFYEERYLELDSETGKITELLNLTKPRTTMKMSFSEFEAWATEWIEQASLREDSDYPYMSWEREWLEETIEEGREHEQLVIVLNGDSIGFEWE